MKGSHAMFSRRQLLTLGAAGVFGRLGIPNLARAQGCLAKPGTLRDRLWLFTVAANADFPSVGRRSLITPAEGALYLGVPNIIVVQDSPSSKWRFESPLEQYTIAFRPFNRILWSVVGSGGYTTREYREEVLGLIKETSNLTGVYLDDFFFTGAQQKKAGKPAALTLDELHEIRHRLDAAGKKLEMAVTFYTALLDLPLDDYLRLMDVVTLWTWKSQELANLEVNLSKMEKLAPGSRKRLGCYFFDYTLKKPVSVATMQYQCELGLRMLRQGRIDGIVLLGNTVVDQGFECVEWTRNWITKVGDTLI